jgi:hypothetical protein
MDDKDVKMILGLITGLENIIGLLLRHLIGNNAIHRDGIINGLKEMVTKIESEGKDVDGMERFPINQMIQILLLTTDPAQASVLDRVSLNGSRKPN